MESLKILIADSSPVYKKMFRGAIKEIDDDAEVVCVGDGKEASTMLIRKMFDILIVDAEIKETGLLELLKFIAKETPKTFVLVTARPSSTSAKVFMEAMSKGASDSMTKPIYDSYNVNFGIIKHKMTDIMMMLLSEGERKKTKPLLEISKDKAASSTKQFRPQIILIAVSTGGPRALETIIPELRADLPVPILIVQHMPPHFIETLAQRLDSKSALNVKVAEDGEKAVGGTVYLAPGGVHTRLNRDNEFYLDDSPPINGVRPAADSLFDSVAEDFSGNRVLAIVLTGMGHDSLRGLTKLKDKKRCFCIAQSEKTCVVFGMPRAVIEDDLVDKILDLEKIAPEIEGFNYI